MYDANVVGQGKETLTFLNLDKFHNILVILVSTKMFIMFCNLKFRPGSHQTSFQYEELMIEIIKHFKSNNDNESLKKLLNISYNHG